MPPDLELPRPELGPDVELREGCYRVPEDRGELGARDVDVVEDKAAGVGLQRVRGVAPRRPTESDAGDGEAENIEGALEIVGGDRACRG